jgi:PKD repeat protein
LQLEVTGQEESYLGRYVRAVGWPTETVDDLSVTLKMQDGYGPALTDHVDLGLDIAPAPDGVPVVTFDAEVTPDPFTFQFGDTTNGSSGWYWDFGDGSASTERSPVHTYAAEGTYAVTHRAKNGNGWGPPASENIEVKDAG